MKIKHGRSMPAWLAIAAFSERVVRR